MEYPLWNHPDIRSKTGKKPDEITLEAVKNGSITAEDIKISQETLAMQGAVAKENNRPHLAKNFDRAAELVQVPDAVILEIYSKLRPYHATKEELLEIAERLHDTYGAHQCAALVLDAVAIYETRGILK